MILPCGEGNIVIQLQSFAGYLSIEIGNRKKLGL